MNKTMRQLFEETMAASFIDDKWKQNVPIRQQLDLENFFMSGVQAAFITLMNDPARVQSINDELELFGKVIIERYEEAGEDTGEEEYDAHQKAKANKLI